MRIGYKFSSDEIGQRIYLVGETFKLGSHKTSTVKGKRLYADMVTDKERADRLVVICKNYYSRGLKSDVDLTMEDIITLLELVDYCLCL